MRLMATLLICNHINGEDRADCFTLSSLCHVDVSLVVSSSRTLQWVGLCIAIVAFPGPTHCFAEKVA